MAGPQRRGAAGSAQGTNSNTDNNNNDRRGRGDRRDGGRDRRGGDDRASRPLLVVIGLLTAQGAIGGIQWALKLPAELVWLHIAVATFTWLAMLWTVAAAGRLVPRQREESAAPVTPADAAA